MGETTITEALKNRYISPKRIDPNNSSKIAQVFGAVIGVAGFFTIFLTAPFLFPALRKHCLPYVPATDSQLANISKALKKHARKGNFLDIGSGDGRICRLAAKQGLFSQVHGVELNSMLVLFSRFKTLNSGQYKTTKYFHRNLWRFPVSQYDNVCIFGVESMMQPLQNYLIETRTKPQIVFACRFPFKNSTPIEEIGEGIDTVWIYDSSVMKTVSIEQDEVIQLDMMPKRKVKKTAIN